MDDLLELISASLDGALSPDQEKQLQAWLDRHPEDRVLYQQLAQTSAALGDLPPVEVPPQLTDRIMAALPKKKPLPWGRWLAAAALVSLVLAGGYVSTWRTGKRAATLSAPAAQEVQEIQEVQEDTGGGSAVLFSVQEAASQEKEEAAPQEEGEAAMDTFHAASERKLALPAAPQPLAEPPQEVWDRVREGLDPAGELSCQGLSPNGRYWLFLWTLGEETDRCAAPLDGSQVVWESQSRDFRELIEG